MRIEDGYEARRLGFGYEFREAVDAAVARIAENPRAYPDRYRGARRALMRRFPYILWYRALPDLVVVPDALMVSEHAEGHAHRRLIVELAAETRLPAIYAFRSYLEAGGLMAYWPDENEISRLSADYVDRIFKGANPAELPFHQPTRFALGVNLKTANILGLTIQPSLLARADEVIQ